MFRLLSTIQKELLILRRDKGGLAIMFLMPMAMIMIMAIIQDAPFRDYQELRIPLLLANKDTGQLGRSIEEGIRKSKFFVITTSSESESAIKQSVKAGDYDIAIIIPTNASSTLDKNVGHFVNEKLVQAGLGDSSATKPATGMTELQILFAPDTKASFKASILSTLRQAVAKVETQTLLNYFSKELNKSGAETGNEKPMDDFVGFREISTIDTPEEALKLNSVQHNVPAWTIFGMFFIVISMAGSIIKERDDGSYTRLLTMPGNYMTILGGKISAYLIVCLLQCVLMLLAGYFLLPLMGLPRLVIGSATGALLLIAVCTGLAATGFGVFVGTVFRTHQQASTFGAVSVVILAALGGIWIPVFVMPENIRLFAELSPLYWSLSAFHKIFLNNAGLAEVIPYAIKLVVFFLIALTGSWMFNRSKNR